MEHSGGDKKKCAEHVSEGPSAALTRVVMSALDLPKDSVQSPFAGGSLLSGTARFPQKLRSGYGHWNLGTGTL